MQEKGRIEFWGAGTMRTFRPLWVAEELGLEYILHGIGPRTGETQTPHYTGSVSYTHLTLPTILLV